jgi:hypothetical protein
MNKVFFHDNGSKAHKHSHNQNKNISAVKTDLNPNTRNQSSSISTVTTLQAGRPGIDSRQVKSFFLFTTAS